MSVLPEDLLHAVEPLSGGGQIIALDTGATITPEALGMICARFSRWNGPVMDLVTSTFDRDTGKFLRENYDAGYGHKSIAEMAEGALLIESVSMLSAKAIQDFPLYRGQESSTRYIDFSKQHFFNPLGSEEGAAYLERWRSFYLTGTERLIPVLKAQYPYDPEEYKDESDYRRAIKARALDIMRGFLPAGCSTNVAWVGDLRHLNDHLTTLRHHALAEVREVSIKAEQALIRPFPNSFKLDRREQIEAYLDYLGNEFTYFESQGHPEFELVKDGLDYGLLEQYQQALATRPLKAELPWQIRQCGTLHFDYLLDFASFRDLQRHRSIIVPMPLLTTDFGFEDWYLNELPPQLQLEAIQLLDEQLVVLSRFSEHLSKFDLQYYLPMGFRVPIRQIADLRALVYKIELRTTRFVHPTLVTRELKMAEVTSGLIPGIQFNLDPEPNRFDAKRGTHDFVKKQ